MLKLFFAGLGTTVTAMTEEGARNDTTFNVNSQLASVRKAATFGNRVESGRGCALWKTLSKLVVLGRAK